MFFSLCDVDWRGGSTSQGVNVNSSCTDTESAQSKYEFMEDTGASVDKMELFSADHDRGGVAVVVLFFNLHDCTKHRSIEHGPVRRLWLRFSFFPSWI